MSKDDIEAKTVRLDLNDTIGNLIDAVCDISKAHGNKPAEVHIMADGSGSVRVNTSGCTWQVAVKWASQRPVPVPPLFP